MTKKILIILSLFILSFSIASANNDLKTDINNKTDYIKITPKNNILNFFRSYGGYAEYKLEYYFQRLLSGDFRYFPGNSICITTEPSTGEGEAPKKIRRFDIYLYKKGIIRDTLVKEKVMYADEGVQTIRWDGLTPGEYRIAFNKYIKQGTGIFDYNGVISSCDRIH